MTCPCWRPPCRTSSTARWMRSRSATPTPPAKSSRWSRSWTAWCARSRPATSRAGRCLHDRVRLCAGRSLTNYERIADHCSNIAVAMIEVAADKFDTHEYLANVKHGGSVKFERRYEKYRGRYTFRRRHIPNPLKIRLKTKITCLPLWGRWPRLRPRPDEGSLPASTRKRAATITLPSSVRFADSFSLRAKSRLRRLRSDTRLRGP